MPRRSIASAEDKAVFYGYEPGSIEGIASGSPHDPISINDNYAEYPRPSPRRPSNSVSTASTVRTRSRSARSARGIIETTEMGGYPVLEHLRLILGGPVVYTPAVDGAVVLSQRGGDFELTTGQDLAIGYRSHSAEAVQFYLEETLTFANDGPEAGIALVYP